jgi:hypothetical protein
MYNNEGRAIMSMMFIHVQGESYDPYLHCLDDNTDNDEERELNEPDEDN